MRVSSVAKVSLFLLGMLALADCSKDDGNGSSTLQDPLVTDVGQPVGSPGDKQIGTEGGVIDSPDGLLTVTIPQGALSSATTISIQPLTSEAPLGLGNGYRLEPEDIVFDEPVTLTFHYSDELLGSTSEDFLWIVFQEKDGSWNAMLKSAVNTNEKTVTVETTHFSDWSLGRFIDLTLAPTTTSLKKGDKVSLAVAGFDKGSSTDDDDLAPLIPVSDDDLAPLTPITPNEERLVELRIVSWTLNGSKAPVSNKYGSLKSSKNTATYTAPSTVPQPNVVAVTVELEASYNGKTEKGSYYVTSNITIIDDNLYLKLNFNGKTYTYYQYGINGVIPEDPLNSSLANCGFTDNELGIACGTLKNGEVTDGFGISFEGPSVGSRGLIGFMDGGHDDIDFSIINSTYEMLKITRTKLDGGGCDVEYDNSYHVTMTLTEFSGEFNGEIIGSFTGTLYYDGPEYENDCKSTEPYAISGDFHLVALSGK